MFDYLKFGMRNRCLSWLILFLLFFLPQCDENKSVEITSLSLYPRAVEIQEGESIQLSVMAIPKEARVVNVSWHSSDVSVAIVSQTGLVTGVVEGSASVSARIGSVSSTSSITVTKQYVPVDKVTLNKSSIELTEGDTDTLTATVSPGNATNGKVTWYSSRPSIVSVDNGVIKALSEGEAIIEASADGKVDKCVVRVSKKHVPVESVTLSPATLELFEGDISQLTVAVLPSDATNKTVTWTSSDSSVASVYDGAVTAVKQGSAEITAKAGDKQAKCAVSVKQKYIAVQSVTMNYSSIDLKVGDTKKLTATVSPSNATDKSISWSTSDSSVATVSEGVVTAISEGTTTVKASSGEKSATCTVTVEKRIVKVSQIILSANEVEIEIGKTYTLTASVLPEDATDKRLVWSSGKTSIATVDGEGKITGIYNGTTRITVISVDGGATAYCSVKVVSPTYGSNDNEEFDEENEDW